MAKAGSENTRLKNARINKGLTQEDLARQIGVAARTISRHEKKPASRVILNAIAIAKAVDSNVETIFGD